MQVKTVLLAAALSGAPGLLYAQFDFTLDGKNLQVHSFASQGFAYSNDNNYLTMKTSQGSFAMTDGGVNISTQLTDNLRVGAQVYDRDIGRIGSWHPDLDWAYAQYHFKDWLGFRAGKVKTSLGLFNDTQDNDALHTFALLPQSVYPTDLRDATIAHTGGDVYGTVGLKALGSLSYTGFVGHRQDTPYGGYTLMVEDRGINMPGYYGLQYGGDVKWNTPVKNLVLGGSHLIEDVTGTGDMKCNQALATINCVTWTALSGGHYKEYSHKEYSNYFDAEYTIGNLRVDSEYRRYYRDQSVWNGLLEVRADSRGVYVSAAYRLSKRLELGSYYSRFTCGWIRTGTGISGPVYVTSLDTSQPGNHIYDTVITGRVDLMRFWNIKVEGHFMDGYGTNQSPDGFYATDNPAGFKPKTRMLLIRTGWSF